MKCQNCGINEANFHYTSNINGNVTESHLCSECAAKTGYADRASSAEREFGNMFRDMFYGIRGYWPPFGINMPRAVSVPPQMGILTENKRAPDVGVTVDEDMKKRREINILREQMRQAAEREDFERAIELREDLRKCEG